MSNPTKRKMRKVAVAASMAMGLALLPLSSPAGAQTEPESQDTDAFCVNVPEDSDPFTDVGEDNVHQENIQCADFTAITTGTGDGTTYSPDVAIPRDQLATFIVNLIEEKNDLEVDDTGESIEELPAYDGENQFSDVDEDNVHVANINRLADAGVIEGFDDGTYGPNIDVQRDQLATFINGAELFMTGSEFGPGDDAFTDDDGNVHEDNIDDVASEGIVVGDGQGMYNPDENARRDQMATFIIATLAVNFEDGLIRAAGEEDAADDDVTVDNTTVEQGEAVTGTVGEDVATLSVSGCSLDEQDVAIADDDTFSVTIPADQPAGECDLTFTTTDGEGNEDTTVITITVTEAPGQPTATDAPELVSAAILGTTEPGEVTPGNPAGTTVSYSFDSVIENGTTDDTEFMVYNADGTLASGSSADGGGDVVAVDGDTVVVNFSTIDMDAAAAQLTLATVDFEAVNDDLGRDNPEGEAPIGEGVPDQVVTTPPGITDGPDLLTVDNFRQGAMTGQTAVDFTFDEDAFQDPGTAPTPGTNTDPEGYQLVLPDGTLIECLGPNGTPDDTPSGGTSPGGNGTEVHTVICENPGQSLLDPEGDPLTAENVSRGVLDYDSHTVEAEMIGGNFNIQQTVDLANGGNTDDPDLVSVEILSDTDQALFTFDEAVVSDDTRAGEFYLYDFTRGTVANPGLPGDEVDVNSADPTEVLVTFNLDDAATSNPDDVDFTTAGTLDIAAGAYIDGDESNDTNNAELVGGPAAVLALDNGAGNKQDEVPLQPAGQPVPGQEPGEVDAPQLVSVEIEEGTDAFGNPTGDFEATYTFDENVAVASVGNFLLYEEDGNRLVADACVADGPLTPTDPSDDNSVTCDSFTGAMFGDAVLGTVDDGAVIGDDTTPNPEGAAVIAVG